MTTRKIISPIRGRISYAIFPALVGVQTLRLPGADQGTETALLAGQNISGAALCALVLALFIERWHRDDYKEASKFIRNPRTGVTESQSFKGYDSETIIELFSEAASDDEAIPVGREQGGSTPGNGD